MKLAISQVLLERAVFKHRPDYLTVAADTPPPPSGVNVSAQVQRADQNPNGAALVRLTATSAEGAVYQFEISYVVFYLLEWEEGEAVPDNLDHRLTVTGSTMLLPFIRETVASLTGRGRFGPSWLAPTNFAELFAVRPAEAEAVSSSGQ